MTVISHKYKFIFLKTGKTGGTSVEMLLNKVCGPKDICPPVTKWGKWNRGIIRPGEEDHEPRNARGLFLPHPFLDRPWRKGNGSRIKSEFREAIHGWKFRSHMGAIEIRTRLGRKRWDEYYKFTIERNPWDKAVSAYYFSQRNPKHKMSFEEWVTKNFPDATMDFYSIDGKNAMDHVIQYDQLETGLTETLQKLGVTEIPELPRTKKSFRPDRAHYRDVHTDVTRDYVAKVCSKEIAAFNYTF